MDQHLRKISKKPGLSPGTLIYLGEKKSQKVKIEIIDYTESQLIE